MMQSWQKMKELQRNTSLENNGMMINKTKVMIIEEQKKLTIYILQKQGENR